MSCSIIIGKKWFSLKPNLSVNLKSKFFKRIGLALKIALLVLSSQSFEGDEVLEGVLLDRVQLVVGQTPATKRVAVIPILNLKVKKKLTGSWGWWGPRSRCRRPPSGCCPAGRWNTNGWDEKTSFLRGRGLFSLGPIDASPPEPERTRLIALERSQSQDSPKRASAPGNAAAKH